MALALISIAPCVGFAQQRPNVWRVLKDGAATDSVYHVAMPPGWHVTTGPGALVFDPANQGKGRFSAKMEVFLFEGTSSEGYGIFLGGVALDGNKPSYVAFLARRDGRGSIQRVTDGAAVPVVEWIANTAIKAHTGSGTAFNTLSVSVEPDSIRFEANGARVAAIPRSDLPVDGPLGFRIGRDVNVHITNLDVTNRLAPPRAAAR